MRLEVTDLAAAARLLGNNRIGVIGRDGGLLVPATQTHGLALEFVKHPETQITRHNPAAVHAPSSGYSMGLELSLHRRLLFVSGQVPVRADGSLPAGFNRESGACGCQLALFSH